MKHIKLKEVKKELYIWELMILAGIYLLKVNNRNTRTRRETCSKLTIKIPKRLVSIVNSEHVIGGQDEYVGQTRMIGSMARIDKEISMKK